MQQHGRQLCLTYHRGYEIPGFLGRARGSRIVIIARREQFVKGQGPIMIAVGHVVARGLLEWALAHGASWRRCWLISRPRSFFYLVGPLLPINQSYLAADRHNYEQQGCTILFMAQKYLKKLIENER